MINIQKIVEILDLEFKKNPTPIVDLIEIQTKDPFKVLIATILSARTKDETTSKVITKLFKKVKSFNDLESLTIFEIEKLIYPIGFYRQKAKYLKQLPVTIKELFNYNIPDSIEDMIKLPGVGRKTANLVRAVAFKKPAICVDVHVHRINNRIGYVKTKIPQETEFALRKKLPKNLWIRYNSIFVSFGQNLCKPINPKCNICPIFSYCQRVSVKSKYLE